MSLKVDFFSFVDKDRENEKEKKSVVSPCVQSQVWVIFVYFLKKASVQSKKQKYKRIFLDKYLWVPMIQGNETPDQLLVLYEFLFSKSKNEF